MSLDSDWRNGREGEGRSSLSAKGRRIGLDVEEVSLVIIHPRNWNGRRRDRCLEGSR